MIDFFIDFLNLFCLFASIFHVFARFYGFLSSVTRSIRRMLDRLNLDERIINAFVSIRPNPRTEVMARLQMPARLLQRRESVPVIAAVEVERTRLEQQNNMVGLERSSIFVSFARLCSALSSSYGIRWHFSIVLDLSFYSPL